MASVSALQAPSLAPVVPPPVIPSPAIPGGADPAKMRKAAMDFEAMAIGQLLAPMFDTVDTAHSLFGGGDGEAAWKPMLIAEFGKHIAAHGGLGLAAPVMQAMIRMQEARSSGPKAPENLVSEGVEKTP